MSTSYQGPTDGSEQRNELIMHEPEPEPIDEKSNAGNSMRDMAARIPEQLSAIGRDISRTIEKAISAKDDYMLAVKVSADASHKLGQLVQAGVFGTRAEAASFLIDQGIKTQTDLFERVEQKLAEIERLRAELRGMVAEKKTDEAPKQRKNPCDWSAQWHRLQSVNSRVESQTKVCATPVTPSLLIPHATRYTSPVIPLSFLLSGFACKILFTFHTHPSNNSRWTTDCASSLTRTSPFR